MSDEAPDDISELTEPQEETVPIIIAVHNGIVQEGRPMFVPSHYMVPITELHRVQRLLSKWEVLT